MFFSVVFALASAAALGVIEAAAAAEGDTATADGFVFPANPQGNSQSVSLGPDRTLLQINCLSP